MIKKLLKIIAVILSIILLVLIIVPFLYQDKIEALLKKELNNRLNADVQWESVSISFLRSFPKASCTIQGASVTGRGDFSNVTLLEAQRIQLATSWRNLIRRKEGFVVQKVRLDDALLHVQVKKNGLANYNILKSSDSQKEKPGNIVLKISDYRVNHLNFQYIDSLSQIYTTGKNLQWRGNGTFSASDIKLNNRLSLDSLNYKQGQILWLKDIHLNSRSEIHFVSSDQSFTLDNLMVTLNELPLEIGGELTITQDSQFYDLNIASSETEFKNFLSLLPSAYTEEFEKTEASGLFTFKGTVKGIYDADTDRIPNFDIQAKISNSSFKYPDLAFPVENINAEINATNENQKLQGSRITIPAIAFEIDGEKMTGSADYTFAEEAGAIDATLSGELDLQKFAQAYPIGAGELRGKCRFDLAISTDQEKLASSTLSATDISGYMNIRDFSYRIPERPEISIPEMDINTENEQLVISANSARYGQSVSDINGSIQPIMALFSNDSKINGNFRLTAEFIDYSEFITKKGQQTSPGESFRSLYDRIQVDLEGTAETIHYNKYILKNSYADARFASDQMRIANAGAQIGTTHLRVTGTIQNIYDYRFRNDTLSGNLVISSDEVRLNDFATTATKKTGEQESVSQSILLPDFAVFEITPQVKLISYDNLKIYNPYAQIHLKPNQLDVANFRGQSMNGSVELDAAYNTSNPLNPSFEISYSLSNIDVQEAVQSVKFLKFIAPVTRFIKGKFNSDLALSGGTNELLFPDFNTLTGFGFFQTIDAEVSGFPPFEKIKQLFNLNHVKEWTIQNTKNWFEIKNGTVLLTDFNVNLENIRFQVKGQHQISADLNYVVRAHVPMSLMKEITGLGLPTTQIQSIIDKIPGSTLQLNPYDTISIDIIFSGPMDNLQMQIANVKPLQKLSPQDLLSQAKDHILSSTWEQVKPGTGDTLDTLHQLQTILPLLQLDSLKDIIASNKDSLIMGKQPALDDVFKQSKDNELDSLKSKLEKFNPFKKKKKGN